MKLKAGKPRPAFTAPWTPEEERQAAREAGLKAFGIKQVFTNQYYCRPCNLNWDIEWDSACDDRCEGCGTIYTPYDYDIDNEFPEEE